MAASRKCNLSMESRWAVFWPALLLSALLACVGSAAQAAPDPKSPPERAPQEETFYESLDVQVVSIEVFVTDQQGQPAPRLTREDFELFEDGRKVEITNFYAEQPAPEGEAGAPDSASEEAAESPSPFSDDQRLYLAVLIDNRSLTAPARNRALQSVRGFLTTHLKADDRVMLATYDGSLSIPLRPTAEIGAFDAALDEALRSSPRGSEQRLELDRLVREIQGASLTDQSAGMEADAIYAGIRLYGERRLQEVKATIAMLRRFVGSLGGLPGRKVVLYVSEGLPMRPVEMLMQLLDRKYQSAPQMNQGRLLESMTFDATGDLRTLIAAANASRVTFYSLAAGSPEGSGERFSPLYSSDLAANERFNAMAPLVDMAGATGGFATTDANTPGPLVQQALRDFSTYYSLGYLSPSREPGKSHRIEVKVKRPGLKVRHRENYVARSGTERTRDRTRAALLLGETRNPLEVGLDFGAESRDKDGNVLVDVTVRFPLSKLVLLPAESFHEGRAWVFLGTRDSQGRSSDVTQIVVPIRVPNDQLMTALGQSAGYRTQLLMRPEPHQVVVGVRDDLGNNDSTLIADFTPGGQDGAAVPGSPE